MSMVITFICKCTNHWGGDREFVNRSSVRLSSEYAEAERTEENDAKLIEYLNDEYVVECPDCRSNKYTKIIEVM